MQITFIGPNDNVRRHRTHCYYFEKGKCSCSKSPYLGIKCGNVSRCDYYSEGRLKNNIAKVDINSVKDLAPMPVEICAAISPHRNNKKFYKEISPSDKEIYSFIKTVSKDQQKKEKKLTPKPKPKKEKYVACVYSGECNIDSDHVIKRLLGNDVYCFPVVKNTVYIPVDVWNVYKAELINALYLEKAFTTASF